MFEWLKICYTRRDRFSDSIRSRDCQQTEMAVITSSHLLGSNVTGRLTQRVALLCLYRHEQLTHTRAREHIV